MRFISAYSRTRVATIIATLLALAVIPAGAAQAAPKLVKLRFSSLSYSVNEPTSGTTSFTATVLRSGNTRVAASVHYATKDGTATDGVDYDAASGTLSFAPGVTRQTFTVTVRHNGITGPASKSLSLVLSSSSPDSLPPGQSTATLTIFDTDGPGTIDFASPTYRVVESAGMATITVDRASASNLVETVDYTTTQQAPGTGHATAGADYTTTSGTLTFAMGEMSKTFQVPIIDDSLYEGDETLQLTLSHPTNLTTADQPVLGPNNSVPTTLTIVDDDVPTFSFDQSTYSVQENAGNATITVDRGGDTSIPASIDYATSDGTAVAGTDYTTATGTLSFAAGQTQASFQVPIIDNTTGGQPNRTVGLHLSQGGTEVDSALLSIVDDDPGNPSVQLSNSTYSVDEGAGTANVTVTLSHDPASDVTVHLSTGSPSDTATAGSDYTAIADQTLTFHHGGALTQVVPIQITDDAIPEDDETFTVKLASPSAGVVLGAPSQAKVTILDNDGAGTLDFSALRYDVNEAGGHATITVHRSGGSAGAAAVDYATSDGTAHAPGDYTATSGTLNFADGETTKTFDVPVAWDAIAEGDETVSLTLSNFDSDDDPATTKVAVLHIADDGASGPVQFSAPSYSVLESAGAATITVNRSGGSLGGPVTVGYATSDGTAHAGRDYAATHGTLTFGPGEASRTFQVPVNNDAVHQGGRSLTLTLSNPGGGTSLGSRATAALNIGDDDPISSSSKDRTPPRLKLTAKRLQKLSAGALVLKVGSNEAARLHLTANLRKGKRLVRVATLSTRVGAGRTVTIRLRLSAKTLSKLRAALVSGRASISLGVTGKDAAGNAATVRRTITVR